MATKRLIKDDIVDGQTQSIRVRQTYQFDNDIKVECGGRKVLIISVKNDNRQPEDSKMVVENNVEENPDDVKGRAVADNPEVSDLPVIDLDEADNYSSEPEGRENFEVTTDSSVLAPYCKQQFGDSVGFSEKKSDINLPEASAYAVIQRPKSHDDPSPICSVAKLTKTPHNTLTGSSSKTDLTMNKENTTVPVKSIGSEKCAESPTGTISTITDPSGRDIVQLLADNTFWSGDKSIEKVNSVLNQGRPTPMLVRSEAITNPQTKTIISLSQYTYQKIPWLTGSKTLGKYFCWPCLLFSPEMQWSLPGHIGWKDNSIAILSHQISPVHVSANKILKSRTESLVAPKPTTLQPFVPQPTLPVEAIRKNRRFLELLIRIICSKKTKPQNSDMDFDGYEELMKVAITHDPELNVFWEKRFSEDALVDFVSSHTGKLLASIARTVKDSVWKEIRAAPCSSVIYEDAANVVDKISQVALIIRYVDDEGQILERFWKFVKLGGPRSAHNTYQIHLSLMNELKLEKKLVGFSYSGTVVAPLELEAFNAMIVKRLPRAKYYHCPDHNFKELLLQSLSHTEPSRYFFQVICDLVEFFSTNAGAIPTLVNFVKASDPKNPWLFSEYSFTHNLISTIKLCFPLVLQFFVKVSEKCRDDEVVRQAPEFVRFLSDYQNRFLIAVVSAVLDCVDELSRVVESEFHPLHWLKAAATAYNNLLRIKRLGAKHFMFAASSPTLHAKHYENFIHPELPRNICHEHFSNIIDIAINCVRRRFQAPDAFYIGKPSPKFADVIKDRTIRDRFIAYGYGTHATLKHQIDSFRAFELIFRGKTITEHVKLMKTLGMTQDFSEFHKFLRFSIMVAPPNPTNTQSTISKLKSYVKDKKKLTSTDVFLYLEKESISELIKTNQFFDDVINHYARSNNESVFLYDDAHRK